MSTPNKEFRCTHKANWAPGQRKCLRCHAKYEAEHRKKVRQLREVTHDLLGECQAVICEDRCAGSSHCELCRMVSCMIRISKPGESRRNRNKPVESETMRKLAIWYKENDLENQS